VSEALFDRVRRDFSEDEIVELTATIAVENFRSKFNAPLRIEAQGFCPIPVDPRAP
jgi:alkylhydroperoxidase family enzyme